MVENNFKQVNEDAEVAQRQYVTYDDWQSFQGYVHESNKSASAAIFSVFLCLIISIWILMIPFNGNPPDWAVIVSAFVIFIVPFIVVGIMEKDNHDVATNTWVKRKDLKAQGWTEDPTRNDGFLLTPEESVERGWNS